MRWYGGMTRKVMIADDEKKICQLLQVLVDWDALGFEVIDVKHNGRDLLEAARRLNPDVIITDIRMPGYTGLEILHELRKENQDVEVLIMSGYREFEYVQAALRDGATDYLLKPLDRAALEEALRKIRERQDAFQQEKAKVEKIRITLDEASSFLQENLLDMILAGKVKQVSRSELNSKYQCGFIKAKLCIAAVKIDILGDNYSYKAEEVVGQKFQSIVETELKKGQYQCLCMRKNNYIFVLVNYEDEQSLEGDFYHLIYKMKEYLAHISDGHVTIGVASVKEDQLYDALLKSENCARDQIFRGFDKVLYYQEHIEEVGVSEVFHAAKIEKLQGAVLHMELSEVLPALQNILYDIRAAGERTQSGMAVHGWMMKLQDILIESCRELLPQEEMESFFPAVENQLCSCHDWNAYREVLQKEIHQLLQMLREQWEKKEKQPIRIMKQLIEQEYQKPITLEHLAEKCEFSSTYVSRLFKKELGMNFSQYLNQVRLEKAKKLLVSTNASTAQIALETGYNDEKYFMRIFKREVGLTTGEYRRLYGE